MQMALPASSWANMRVEASAFVMCGAVGSESNVEEAVRLNFCCFCRRSFSSEGVISGKSELGDSKSTAEGAKVLLRVEKVIGGLTMHGGGEVAVTEGVFERKVRLLLSNWAIRSMLIILVLSILGMYWTSSYNDEHWIRKS